MKRLILVAIALGTLGTSVAAEARPDDRRHGYDQRHDRYENRNHGHGYSRYDHRRGYGYDRHHRYDRHHHRHYDYRR